MKLNVITFARVIARITFITNWNFNRTDLEDIYDMIEFEVPEPQPNKVDQIKLNSFIVELEEAKKGKIIPAVKIYREFTGCSLLEAKTTIEHFCKNKG